ncbi:hypothetical protein SAMN05216249_102216 [Acetitomaculum ruminis DSM 5522]|uniref:Cell division protein FtsL n=1 Tax=Acetitomaculum ruminis DSM 5522 TaxID=1120918 RepID=A0A1I0VUX2_9FIRM|nr:hypothetical protein [Acetitomaculum ruminis]SFA80215.1 hypothetical protein SAMN05216249_102216 [Acetitomaculum ruminis DSM 5522]
MATRQDKRYMYGSLAPQIEPERFPKRRKNKRPVKRIDPRIVNKRNRELNFSAGYVVFLSICALMVCCSFLVLLKLKSDQINLKDEISSTKQAIIELKDDNDTHYDRILSSIDYNEIKRIAIDEYGMVYPNKDQIYNYNVEEDDCMNQYEDIPTK